jgi:haloacetate dehalogenase
MPYSRFLLAGHDRGGRVAYRMALDHPGQLRKVIVLDILPTYDSWVHINRNSALRIFIWSFLAQPYPVPEQLREGKTDAFFDPIFGEQFDSRAAEHYLAALRDPLRVHGLCEDYRAGAYADLEHDKVDVESGNKISTPLHVHMGNRGYCFRSGGPF